MKKQLLKSLVWSLLLAATACGTQVREPESVLLFARGDNGSKFYRIPALVTAADGSLVAAIDKRIENMGDLPNKIDIVARRSTDGGRTWSEVITIVEHRDTYGYGDPALVLDRNSGDLLCICAAGAGLWGTSPENPTDICVMRSRDNGQTWEPPQTITSSIYGRASHNPVSEQWQGAFAASGRAHQLRDGTLLFVIAVREAPGSPLSNYVCASKDGGYTWELLPTPADRNGDEAKIVELVDGSWLMSIRNPRKGHRKYSISHDRGATWSAPAKWADLTEPACNGDMIRYTFESDGFSANRLLHSIPFDPDERRNVSLLMSYDEGRTWPVRKCIWEGDAGYSSLTVLPDGTIGMLTEVGGWGEGFDIYFTRIMPEWLTDGVGRDSYK